jgi:hypothetical protein
MHGWGVVCGLGATQAADTAGNPIPYAVCVAPGVVLGPYGDEIVVDAITGTSMQQLDGWVRAFMPRRDGAIFGFDRLMLRFQDARPGAGGTSTLTALFVNPNGAPLDWASLGQRPEVLVIIRPDAASGGGAPVGAAEPHVLLDADFIGTALDTQTVLNLFDGQPPPKPPPFPEPNPVSTDGATLHDGTPGGLVHYWFTALIALPAPG